jgi:hypothetical protein
MHCNDKKKNFHEISETVDFIGKHRLLFGTLIFYTPFSDPTEIHRDTPSPPPSANHVKTMGRLVRAH